MSRGFFILERNYRTEKGEVDIIARKKNLLLIVEVKTRSVESQAVVAGRDAVDREKIARLERVASTYQLKFRRFLPRNLQTRIDMIEIILNERRRLDLLTHFENFALSAAWGE
ncbi:MAG: YraN family protein [Bdellovibrionales bacterium]|nr:YraN family protein [Bdellovibrionales bacterium]